MVVLKGFSNCNMTLFSFSGFVVPFKAHFNEDSPIWLLGRCYHARNHGKLLMFLNNSKLIPKHSLNQLWMKKLTFTSPSNKIQQNLIFPSLTCQLYCDDPLFLFVQQRNLPTHLTVDGSTKKSANENCMVIVIKITALPPL